VLGPEGGRAGAGHASVQPVLSLTAWIVISIWGIIFCRSLACAPVHRIRHSACAAHPGPRSFTSTARPVAAYRSSNICPLLALFPSSPNPPGFAPPLAAVVPADAGEGGASPPLVDRDAASSPAPEFSELCAAAVAPSPILPRLKGTGAFGSLSCSPPVAARFSSGPSRPRVPPATPPGSSPEIFPESAARSSLPFRLRHRTETTRVRSISLPSLPHPAEWRPIRPFLGAPVGQKIHTVQFDPRYEAPKLRSARALGQAGATGVGRRVGMAHGRRGVVALLFLVACLSHAHEGHEHEENEVKFPPLGRGYPGAGPRELIRGPHRSYADRTKLEAMRPCAQPTSARDLERGALSNCREVVRSGRHASTHPLLAARVPLRATPLLKCPTDRAEPGTVFRQSAL